MKPFWEHDLFNFVIQDDFWRRTEATLSFWNDLYFTRFYLLLQFFDATKGLSNRIVSNRMHSLLLLPLKSFFLLKRRQLRNYLLLIFLIVRKLILEFLIIWSINRISSFCKHIPISRKGIFIPIKQVFLLFVKQYLTLSFYIPLQDSYSWYLM